VRLPRNDWYAYSAEHGFGHIGQCDKSTAEKTADTIYPDGYDFILQAYDMKTMFEQIYKAIKYHRDLEEEHTECMRHDAETGRDDDDDLESDVHEESEDDDE